MGRRPRHTRVAIHEAGHALLSEIAGLTVESMTIVPKGDAMGRVSYEDPPRLEHLSPDDREPVALALAAGMAADVYAFQTRTAAIALDDEAEAEGAKYFNLERTDNTDLGYLTRLAAYELGDLGRSATPDAVASLVHYWILKARAVLRIPVNARALKVIAATLTKRKTITGDELRAILQDTGYARSPIQPIDGGNYVRV